jgi:valyl-tRNA synthetase
MIVEKELQRTEKKSRHDLGRAEFLKRVWEWKEKFGSRIGEQHKALGASLDWERERFTMDEGLSRAVREVFVRLHEEGLIYREKKLINWCPRCHTALSDLEVNHDEAHQGELWSFAYPLVEPTADRAEVVVATTRPETMLGDTAVAVHPDDERYKALLGKKVRHPLTGREIPIVGDAILVDPAFGTGAVKVTPAHDFNDFEVGKRHGLELVSVIGQDGKMTAEAGPVAGLDRFEARKEVKRLLAELGLERGSKRHVIPLGRCQRCSTVLEPLISLQWYVKIEPLARPAIEAVEQGRTRFVPEQWTNTYMAWMRNIHDWCISRQLWWGHQIPAWYCADGHVTVARTAPATCATCGKAELRQDEDVLDTWFSSGLWPFSTMGWPDETATLRTFYPTSVMETGHDIIFFWVARMMMMGLHFMGEVPFRTVYLHPMVRDEKGEKMSKTKGNVIDPLVITEKHGADALRFTLAALTAQGRDIKLSDKQIEGFRAFANKLWNASRFALMNLAGYALRQGGQGAREGDDLRGLALSPADRWILARLQRAVNEAVEALESFRFNDAASTLYQFVWHELCDWYIELSKEALLGDGSPEAAERPARKAAQAVLVRCLSTSYRLLHPFMPFITEELWHVLRAEVKADAWPDSILAAAYPQKGVVDEAAERGFGPVIGIIDAIRNVRGEMNVPPKAEPRVVVAVADPAALATVRGESSRIARLAHAALEVVEGPTAPAAPQTAVAVGPGFELRVHLAGVLDLAAEAARIEKELARLDQDLAGIERKLANPEFVRKAPPEVVDKDRARADELREKRGKLLAHRAMLSPTEANLARRDTMENQNEPKPVVEAAPAPVQPAPAPVAPAVEVAPAAPAAEAPAVKAAPKKKVAKKAAKKPAKKAAKKVAPKKKAAKKVAKKPAKKAKKPAKKAKKKARK